jgi:hypothetical protein
MFFPYYFPMAICSQCCILGRIETLLEKEEEECMGMGKSGILCCLMTFPCAFLSPFPISPALMIISGAASALSHIFSSAQFSSYRSHLELNLIHIIFDRIAQALYVNV